jgi:hypothetical protein
MQKQYREDYQGEFVIVETRITNGRREQKREWVDNPIQNHHISKRAAVIGSRADRDRFDHTILPRHRGGLLGKKKLQTYVTGDIGTDMQADFTVELDKSGLDVMIEKKYTEQNIVYTNATNCVLNPGEFYLIPFNPRLDLLALPMYIAAFDGHKEIFMIGYNNDTVAGTFNWINDINQVMQTYNDVDFFFIGTVTNMPDAWRYNRNFRNLEYRDFVSYCDI